MTSHGDGALFKDAMKIHESNMVMSNYTPSHRITPMDMIKQIDSKTNNSRRFKRELQIKEIIVSQRGEQS